MLKLKEPEQQEVLAVSPSKEECEPGRHHGGEVKTAGGFKEKTQILWSTKQNQAKDQS